ncbi:hypothetical protein DPMN_061687 [Dreissena polymorpha]|uniref:Uncharacterized protein n=1 Tax=Dreissena polymorpha TaxID=45954 RepID=A0A9D4HHD8_DREPO|nr:hypothetical protein DPMN_061687 [Dreissena polymorpha]
MPDDAGWRDDKLTVAMTAAGVACGVTVLAVVVVVGALKCCRKGELRRPSLPTIRPGERLYYLVKMHTVKVFLVQICK